MGHSLNQGLFNPRNREKYKGRVDQIFYRSGYELTFMLWCDGNPNVLEWASEEVVIPYKSVLDEAWERQNGRVRKPHRYFVDFYVKIQERDGSVNKYLVEVKPLHETIQPVKTPKKKDKTYLAEMKKWYINTAKWDAAKKFCQERGLRFKIVTEVELYGRKP